MDRPSTQPLQNESAGAQAVRDQVPGRCFIMRAKTSKVEEGNPLPLDQAVDDTCCIAQQT